MMPLARGELVGLVGLIRVRPLTVGQDALTGIVELANVAAAGADEVVLTWKTYGVVTACKLPVVSPAPAWKGHPGRVHAEYAGEVRPPSPLPGRAAGGVARESVRSACAAVG
ncbi:hypothetical protein SUDANB58_05668 [Streptomyces sp. enrichment culture]